MRFFSPTIAYPTRAPGPGSDAQVMTMALPDMATDPMATLVPIEVLTSKPLPCFHFIPWPSSPTAPCTLT